MLRLHYLSSLTWFNSGNPGSYLRYTKELEEMVVLSKALKADHTADGPFTMDIVVVMPLATLGWACRHRALRREIIDLCSTL
jgi:hypothetical protein